MIALRGLTRRFPGGRGIADLSFEVAHGEVFGFLGPNGAGKSTTLRHLMGFLRPDAGVAEIGGLDCWTQAARVQNSVGYLPGEIGFPDGITATAFLDLLAGMRRLGAGRERRAALLDRFELDPGQAIRKMSKGTRQKVGLVAALMHRPEVLILDEPTSGLDPLMQQRFLECILEEKARGTTVLMSSHAFAEVERVSDRVGIIRQGRLVAVDPIADLRRAQRKVFTVAFGSDADGAAAALAAAGLTVLARRGQELDVELHGDYNALVRALGGRDVTTLDARPLNLEQIFLHFYGAEGGA